MIYYKSDEEIEKIRHSSLLVCKTHAAVVEAIKPGITTKMLDAIAETFIKDNNAVPSFKGYRGYPYTLCISINEQVVHGMPSDRIIKEGDIVSVDCGVYHDGFHGDVAYTYIIGEVSEEKRNLVRITQESLERGASQAIAGNRIGDIGFAIQNFCEAHNMGVVRDLIGHGVGKSLHESPEVPNYGRRGNGITLKEGLVIAIEPMINLGTFKVKTLRDGWTIVTQDEKCSAHFEHTVAVRKNKVDILSDHKIIEDALKNNINVNNFQ
jgi:methionyl aminopeptidase